MHEASTSPRRARAISPAQVRTDRSISSSGTEARVQVIGELKKPEDEIRSKSALLQMARYVQVVFKAQPTRQFIHMFAVCGTKAEV